MKARSFLIALLPALLPLTAGKASFLYNGYLDPMDVGLATQYSSWNVGSTIPFYAPNNNPNYPTTSAPYGTWGSWNAGTGIPNPGLWNITTNPDGWTSSAPGAFWDTRNPTITQTAGPAQIYSGIYGSGGPTSFVLDGGQASASDLGTVIFQFQTIGTLTDFTSIRLVYTNGSGTHELAPDEMIREYAGSGHAFGGVGNRTALQWNLTGLGITSYQILWDSEGSNMSLVQALLDTATSYQTVVPASGRWTGGSGSWSDTTKWAVNSANGNTLPQANGNAIFANSSPATIALDVSPTLGEIVFDTAADTVIEGNHSITANTGVQTTDTATGTYSIRSDYVLASLNLFEIHAGTVRMEGAISGGTQGIKKTGDGTLVFAHHNTFDGSLGVESGTLRVEGTNTYTGSTAVLFGKLIVAADAGTTGALGSASNEISLGADDFLYAFSEDAEIAGIFIDGNHEISRDIGLKPGKFKKELGAQNAGGGALFSGNIDLNTSSDVILSTQNVTDKVTFSGQIREGVADSIENPSTLRIQGPGTVAFSGTNKTYSNNTLISEGTLLIENGTSYTGIGNFVVNGGRLTVNGAVSGTGVLNLQNGTLSGDGAVNRTVVTSGAASRIAPGNSPGTLTLANLDASAGATFDFEIGQAFSDGIHLTGNLISSTAAGGLIFNFTNLGDAVAGIYELIMIDGTISNFDYSDLTLSAAAIASGWQLDTTWESGGWNLDGNTLMVKFSAVPEPSTGLMLLLGAATLAFRSRKKQTE